MPDIRVVTPPLTNLGEAPLWDVVGERLWWIDVSAGAIFRATADGRDIRVVPFPQHPSSLALGSVDGRLLVTSGPRIHRFDVDTGDSEILFDAADRGEIGFNDGTVDRQGRFLTASVDPHLTEPSAFELVGTVEPRGRIYRLSRDGTVDELGPRVGVSNGPCFSPAGDTLYWGDSWARVVYAFDYDRATGAASNQRPLIHFHDHSAPDAGVVPDGSTVDSEGGIWVAACYGSEVRRYAPDGSLDRRIAVPVVSPTSVAFGGSQLDTLFVTSIRESMFPDERHRTSPLAGTVLAVHGLGVRGVPEVRYAG